LTIRASTKLRLPARDPTPQQWKFAEACLSGLSLVDAYVTAYPSRGKSRSRESERVKAKRLAKNSAVVWAMQQVAQRQAEEEAVANPEKVRKECLITLRRVRLGRLDSSYARAILAELREANREIERQEERARKQQRAERDTSWQLLQALDAMKTATVKRNVARATAVRSPSASTEVLPQITHPVRPHDPPLKPVAAPTPLAAAETNQDDELHQYVRAQQADRAAAAPKKPPQRELSYVPGYFPPQPAWTAGRLPPPRTPEWSKYSNSLKIRKLR
jgi:hypothetical protein